MGWLITAVVLIVLLAVWITWTANRIDRLLGRVAAARAALDAQLVRRAAAAAGLVDADLGALGPGLAGALRTAARAALQADDATRESAENALGRALGGLASAPGHPDPVRLAELREAATRVGLARRFHNDAVGDLARLRGQRLPRVARLGGGRPVPTYFEIDDRLWSEPAA